MGGTSLRVCLLYKKCTLAHMETVSILIRNGSVLLTLPAMLSTCTIRSLVRTVANDST